MAWWALRLINGPDSTPWIHIGRSVLGFLLSQVQGDHATSRLSTPYPCPALALLSCTNQGFAAQFNLENVPRILERLVAALASLPLPSVVTPLPPGPWCAHLPLWGNPILRGASFTGLERSTSEIRQVAGPGVATLGDLLRLRLELELWTPNEYLQRRALLRFPGHRCPDTPAIWASLPYKVYSACRTKAEVTAYLDSSLGLIAGMLPEGWLEAANEGTHSGAGPMATSELLLSSLGWRLGHRVVTLSTFTVKAGTILQLRQSPAVQEQQMTQYAALVGENTPVTKVRRMLARVWSGPSDGRSLEVLWRLVLNGLPSSDRIPAWQEHPCGCNTVLGYSRVHLFHECPIVQPLWQAVQHQFNEEWSLPSPGALLRRHVWLAIRPNLRLHQGIWDIIVVQLLMACDKARRNWIDRSLQHQRRSQGLVRGTRGRSSMRGGSIHRPAMAAGPELLESVSNVALAEFWAGLEDVAALGALPTAWLDAVPIDHPFLRPDPLTRTWVVSKRNDE